MTDKTQDEPEAIDDLELDDDDARHVTGGAITDGSGIADGSSNTAGLKAGASE